MEARTPSPLAPLIKTPPPLPVLVTETAIKGTSVQILMDLYQTTCKLSWFKQPLPTNLAKKKKKFQSQIFLNQLGILGEVISK